MRKLSEWQKFERTGRVADYLAYACAESMKSAGKDTACAGAGSMEAPENNLARKGAEAGRNAAFFSDDVSVKAGEDTADYAGKDRSFVYAGYHHGDGNGSEGGTDRGI